MRTSDRFKTAAVIVALLCFFVMLALLYPARASAADNEELLIGAAAIGAGALIWQNNSEELSSEDYRAQLVGTVVQSLLGKFVADGGLGEGAGDIASSVLPVIGGYLENHSEHLLLDLRSAAKEKDDGAVLDVLRDYGMEELGRWIVANGGWRRLWTEIDKCYPLIAQSLYRELPDGSREGVLLEAVQGLYEQGRIDAPTGEALWNSRETLKLTRFDAWWLVDSLQRNLARVEALQDSGQLQDGPLLITSEEWIQQGRGTGDQGSGGSDGN